MDRVAASAKALAAHRRINQTAVPYPADSSVNELFDRYAKRFPASVAVIHRDRSVTYRELAGLATVLVGRLHAHGVGLGSAVGVCVERSPEMIAALLPTVFDAATFEIWGALLHGGTCVLYPSGFVRFSELRRTLDSHDVSVVFLTTALFNAILDEAPETLDGVGTILTGGEAHSLRHVGAALRRYGPDRLTSVYGPTECTTFATSYAVREIRSDETALPIGVPIQNTRAYVVDDDRLCAAGEIGEVLLAGAGLSPGYLGLPAATAERFMEREIDGVAERLYRTGDRAFLRDDGVLVFQGRSDDQVKINGHRVELGEISHHLDRHPDIRQNVVIVHENAAGEKVLAAFIVAENNHCTVPAVRRYLSRRLPAYMVPTGIWLREFMPLSSHW